ncbi:unnamed protein product [Meloidogyne enterolobii]|uniref:Uncharacterized protein n=1 Tax=Meloidogyne enterolobii TaxID=390850 RepID=A0ACB0XQ08_MELEN
MAFSLVSLRNCAFFLFLFLFLIVTDVALFCPLFLLRDNIILPLFFSLLFKIKPYYFSPNFLFFSFLVFLSTQLVSEIIRKINKLMLIYLDFYFIAIIRLVCFSRKKGGKLIIFWGGGGGGAGRICGSGCGRLLN